MAAEERSDADKDEEYYGSFMTALFGLLDDAQLAGYSAQGIEHLRRAQEAFWQEFRARHPLASTRQNDDGGPS